MNNNEIFPFFYYYYHTKQNKHTLTGKSNYKILINFLLLFTSFNIKIDSNVYEKKL
jgi:hypothetical protein